MRLYFSNSFRALWIIASVRLGTFILGSPSTNLQSLSIKSFAEECLCVTMYSVLLDCVMTEKGAVVTVRLSRRDLERVEAVRTLVKVDRSTLLKEFIEDGLRRRVINLYQGGRLTAGRAAEVLGVSLRELLETLEREGIPVNWDSESVKEYLKTRYGESSIA